MKKKCVWIVAAIVLLLLAGMFVFKDREDVKKEIIKDDKIHIGMSFDTFVVERWQRDRDVFVSTAKELGAEVNVQNANGDIEEQKKHIDYFIEKGMDAIVVIGIDSDGIRESVKKAMAEGIIVVSYDRMITNADTDLYISFDNSMVGKMMGESLLHNGIYGGNVVMIGGALTDSNVPLIENKFLEIMAESNVTILDSFHADNWEADFATEYIYDNMDTIMKANAIMCGNDNLASQVVRALAEKRLAGDIFVVGQDADLEACQRIVEGTQLMTVYKPVEKLARRAAECTVQLVLEGKLDGEDVESIDDGTYNIRYVGIQPTSVTKENIDEVIIESGFHLKEDVYLNVPEEMP